MTFLAVTVVAFALTTLDSATRLLRFNVEEIFRSVGLNRIANRYVASLIAVAGIGAFGLLPAGKTMWIMFGTTNQLLAGLTLLTVSLFLFKLGRPVLYTLIPMVAMLTMTIWAMLWSLLNFWNTRPMPVLLIVVSVIVLVMTLWLMVEAALSFARGRGGLNLDAPPGSPDGPEPVHEEEDEVAAHTHLG
jgi:carbon starvation protein